MTSKTPAKKMEFNTEDENFIKQLAQDIGCHYVLTNPRTYSLNKYKTAVEGKTSVFAWVHKEEKDHFWVSTRKTWIDAAQLEADSHTKTPNPGCLPRDTNQADDSVRFDTSTDYHKTVGTLKLIQKAL